MKTRRQLVHESAVAQNVQDGGNDMDQGDVKTSDTSHMELDNVPSTSSGKKRPPVGTKSAASKRTKSTKASGRSRRIEIPHAATLPPIVWVHDIQYSWWPGKISPYPPKDNTATIVRFGNLRPKSIAIECTKKNIVPFEHSSKEIHRQSGINSTRARTFETAYKEAIKAQIKDDDDLPNLDDMLNQVPSAAPINNNNNNNKISYANGQTHFVATIQQGSSSTPSPTTNEPDPSLTLPGELVLARAEKHYYPGRINEFNEKSNKYKIELGTGHTISLERNKFYTRFEKGFQTCPLGELALPEFTEAYWDDELETKVREIYPTLYDIIVGQSDEAERLKAFIQGGKARRTLAQRVGSGNFNRTQFTQISMMLQSEFLPDLNTTKNLPLPSRAKSSKGKKSRDVGQPMKQPGDITKDFSNQKRLHFVTDVLLPETVIRLTMKAHSITHSEADSRILEGVRDQRTDTWWVDDILAARDSFLDGQAHSS